MSVAVDGSGRLLMLSGQMVVPTPVYAFDHFISPTGNDANLGTLASPWSSSAIHAKAGQYTQLGCLPGTYTQSTADGVYGTYINTNGGALPGHQIPNITLAGTNSASNILVIASCDATGKYKARHAVFGLHAL